MQARQGGAETDSAAASEMGKSGLNWDQVVNLKLPAGAVLELVPLFQNQADKLTTPYRKKEINHNNLK